MKVRLPFANKAVTEKPSSPRFLRRWGLPLTLAAGGIFATGIALRSSFLPSPQKASPAEPNIWGGVFQNRATGDIEWFGKRPVELRQFEFSDLNLCANIQTECFGPLVNPATGFSVPVYSPDCLGPFVNPATGLPIRINSPGGSGPFVNPATGKPVEIK